MASQARGERIVIGSVNFIDLHPAIMDDHNSATLCYVYLIDI